MRPLHRVKLSLCLAAILLGVWGWMSGSFREPEEPVTVLEWPAYAHRNLLETLPVAESFSYPMHPPSAEGTYLFKAFGEDNSTAELWKLEPTSEERETPIVAMGDGLVLMAENLGADLNGVVIMLHRSSDPKRPLIESMCAGLDRLEVSAGQLLKKGDQLGVILNAKENGLQWEVRETLGLGISPGTSEDRNGWIKPGSVIWTTFE